MPDKIIIKRGDDLINFVKDISIQVNRLRIGDDVDYMGCSRSYVYEKVHKAISDLEWIIDRIAELNKDRVRCDDCKHFCDVLDKNQLCYRCSDDEDWKEDVSENY